MHSTTEAREGRAGHRAEAEFLTAQVDRLEGRVFLIGLPAWLMFPQYCADVQGQFESAIGRAAKWILYRAAFLSGNRTGESRVGPASSLGTDTLTAPRLLRLPAVASLVGHGHTELEVSDLPHAETTWTMADSQIAALHAPSKESVWHSYRASSQGSSPHAWGARWRPSSGSAAPEGDP